MQFGKQNFVADSGATAVPVGVSGSLGDAFEIFSGGNGVVIGMVTYSPTVVGSSSTLPVLVFKRRPRAGSTTGERSVTINAADGTGSTNMTIPASAAVGDVFRVYFGGDADEEHVLNPGESFAVELSVKGDGGTDAGIFTVHGYQFEVGASVPVKGGLNGLTGAQDKPNSNGVGKIHNLVG